MKLNLGSLSFNINLQNGGGTPSWGTELGQSKGYKIDFEDAGTFLTSMLYCSLPDKGNVKCPFGKGGNKQDKYGIEIASLYKKVYANGVRIQEASFVLLIVKELEGEHHVGRRTIKYNPGIKYLDKQPNKDCFEKIQKFLGLNNDSAWFISEMVTKNQDELHFTAHIIDSAGKAIFATTEERKDALENVIGSNAETHINPLPLQTIYYGSPGTGKSHKIKTEVLAGVPEDKIFRTTFHPDSDYASFVGAYKPAMDGDIIKYAFEPQAFTDAYVEAWKNDEAGNDVFLIIEEINRGNCAQIFGDLFQLLDRKDGYSEYPIKADKALCKYLEDTLGKDSLGIWEGELCLPPNLHILATMNTSDQSLFPMDSAFKRRWEWKYVPTTPPQGEEKSMRLNIKEKMTLDKYGKTINAGNYTYNWTQFLEKINDRILNATHTEDKQLGFWFVGGAETKEISVSTFVSKVVFYLWNDVFKDLEKKDSNPFRIKVNEEYFLMSFNKFFEIDADGKSTENLGVLHTFMGNLGLTPEPDEAPQPKEEDKYAGGAIGQDSNESIDRQIDEVSDGNTEPAEQH